MASPVTLPSLPSLPSLTPAVPVAPAGDEATQIINDANAAKMSASLLIGNRYVIIALGFLLVAAGLFTHDKTRNIIVGAGKTVAEGAAAIAA